MSSINKTLLLGNLGQDPEIRYTPNGDAVANISLATNKKWKDKQGQKQERTEWHRVTMYRQLAELAGKWLKKGSKIFVEGELQTRKWQDQQGNDRYTTEIVVNDMKMMGDGGTKQAAPQAQNQAQNQAQQNGNNQQQNQQAPAMSEPAFDDFDDDCPF